MLKEGRTDNEGRKEGRNALEFYGPRKEGSKEDRC